MPEIPDLEASRAILSRRLAGVRIESVDVPRATVLRVPVDDFRARLTGATFGAIERRGKFLLFHLAGGDVLVVNAMLAGRHYYSAPETRRPARLCYALALSDGHELRYVDPRFMGKVYLVAEGALDSIPQIAEMGPDVLDAALTEEAFLERLRRYRGQVKSVLVNAKFVAGIGNAYSDEILFVAGDSPLHQGECAGRRAATVALSGDSAPSWRGPSRSWRRQWTMTLRGKPREFLRVHRQGGAPCPVCGHAISEVSPNRRVTSFCRSCQPD